MLKHEDTKTSANLIQGKTASMRTHCQCSALSRVSQYLPLWSISKSFLYQTLSFLSFKKSQAIFRFSISFLSFFVIVLNFSITVSIMASKYSIVSGDEKFEKYQQRISEDSLSSTLLEDEDYMNIPHPPPRPIFSRPIWLWLGHGILLSISVTMLLCALYTRNSTIKFVRDFSSYCKSRDLSKIHPLMNLAPAAVAVEYNDLMFDGEMGAGSMYVGASEEVDMAWWNITSVGMFYFLKGSTKVTDKDSGRPND